MDKPEMAATDRQPATQDRAVAEWEARAVGDLSVILTRYRAGHPCPGESRIDSEMQEWALCLGRSGQARREALRVGRLRLLD